MSKSDVYLIDRNTKAAALEAAAPTRPILPEEHRDGVSTTKGAVADGNPSEPQPLA